MNKITKETEIKTPFIGGLYYIFNIVLAFKVYGFGWGIVSIFIPIFPIVHFAIYLVDLIS